MERLKVNAGLILFAALAIVAGYVSYDVLFSEPDHLQGLIVEKVYVPPVAISHSTPYGGVKRGKYFVTAQKDEQWIAIVVLESGDTVSVHCHPDHYRMKEVGEIIHFKKYEGKHVHIKFLAHNEQEE